MGRMENAGIYLALEMAGLLSLELAVGLDVLALFSPPIRRFAVFGLGRLFIYFFGIIVLSLFFPLFLPLS